MRVNELIEELKKMPQDSFLAFRAVMIGEGTTTYHIPEDNNNVTVIYDKRNDETIIRMVGED